MALSHSPRIVTDGLVSYLDASNLKSYSGSGTTWFNLVSSGSNGTLSNGPTFNSDNGGSIVFDGVNDTISLPHSTLSNTRSFTVMMWIKTTSIINPAVRKGICSGRNVSSGSYLSFMGINPGSDGNAALLFESRDANTVYNGVSISNVSVYNTKWSLVGFQVDTSTISVFCHNNIFTFGSTNDSRIGFTFSGWNLGLDTSSFYWPGNISNFMFYTRVLSQSEIIQNFNALQGRYGI